MRSRKGGEWIDDDLRVRGLALVEIRVIWLQMPDGTPLVTEDHNHNEPEAQNEDNNDCLVEFNERQFDFRVVVGIGILMLQVTELAPRLSGKGGDVMWIVGLVRGRNEIHRGRCVPGT
jgi:hypothetical protein